MANYYGTAYYQHSAKALMRKLHARSLPCRMTLSEFNALPVTRQLLEVLTTGTLLATRIEAEDEANLYQLPGGLFVEVGAEARTNRVRVYAFTKVAKLEYYSLFVKLPGWMPESE